MPQLPTYTAQIGQAPASGGRRADAGDFGPDLGNIGQNLKKQADTLVTRMGDDESRKALVAASEIRAKYAKALDDAALSGAPLEPLKEQMRAELAKTGENFSTRKGADAIALHTANSDLMFDEQANNIAVHRAASTARIEGSKFLNSEAAIIQSNPLYLATAEKNADAFVATLQGIRPEMRNEIRDGLRKELNMAAAIGSARIEPEKTKALAEGGSWDLTPEQRSAVIGRADTEIRAKRADEQYQRATKEYDERERDDTARDKNFKGIMAGTVKKRDILDDPNLRPATREHLITFMEERAKALAGADRKSDPRVLRDLVLSVIAPDGTPGKMYGGDAIFNTLKAGKINTTDALMVNNLLAAQKDENGRSIGQKLSAIQGTVGRALSQDPQFASQPALVAEIQLDYQARVVEKTAALRKANQDPTQVFDPASKDYVGSREFIQQSIDAARQKQRDAMPQPTKVNSQAEYDALPENAPYVDSSGASGVKRGKPKAAPVVNDFQDWMKATGGKLKPGQTQAQAMAEWKASK